MKKEILILSDGYGEDTIAAYIAKSLLEKEKQLVINVLPIVGQGTAYQDLNVHLLEPRKKLPTEGRWVNSQHTFHWGNFWKDLRAGFLSLSIKQLTTVCRHSKKTDLILAVGDVILVGLCGFCSKKESLVFIGTAKSNYFHPYSRFEEFFLQRSSSLTVTRDQETADCLKANGINALFFGNPMLDCLVITGEHFGIERGRAVIGLLPGSRADTKDDFLVILDVVERISKKNPHFIYLLALADTLSLENLKNWAEEKNWQTKALEQKEGEVGHLVKGNSLIKVISKRFGDVIKMSDLVLGRAGTGNQQAVGMGKPVVTFYAVENLWLELAQKQLLGDSIIVAERDAEVIAGTILVLFEDKEKVKHMYEEGLKRMGHAGAVEGITSYLLENYLYKSC